MKWYRNQKIKNKLIFGFMVVSILAAIIGGFGILTLLQIKANTDKTFRVNVLALQYAGKAAMKTQAIVNDAQLLAKKDFIQEKDAINTGSVRIMQDIEEVEKILESLGNVVNGDMKNGILNDIASNWSSLKMYIESVIEYMKENNGAELAERAIRISNNSAVNLTSNYRVLIDQISKEADISAEANNQQADIAIILMGSVLVVGFVISILLGNVISKSIGEPLKVMAAVGMRIAEGDVNVSDILTEKHQSLADRKDEIGTLASMVNSLIKGTEVQANEAKLIAKGNLTVEVGLKSERDLLGLSMRELVDKLHNMIVNIFAAAEKVALSSSALSNSSITLSQGVTEQASAVEQLNVTVGEIYKKTEINTENANKANELAQKVKENARAGNMRMQEMLTAMQEINESSKNINKVIKVIDDIAFQTNILALNAAVEAARAGQAGKGFAVVAEEVRALAARSANAVRDTTEMLDGSIKKVVSGTTIAHDTADALNDILMQIERVVELVDAISLSSNEQLQGIKQVNLGISQVSQIVQTNAATAEESAAASEELSEQAEQLREYVQTFRLRDEDGQMDTLSPYTNEKESEYLVEESDNLIENALKKY